ncbi:MULTISPECIES: STAS domain-containing protein [unclassified Streptomyces]|uniref:STAS domain-containing protein n=1 Tax=unclassified Streptomyces TaxID=2593676 RepID=UPI00224DF31C|nr:MULTISPECIES: STAS domain-containing protein [unclassified Streptomyces]MCX5335780.1 STAS domain-containing protein [Streptomyces sp. NBC_00140]MCX5366496.1 STAS domain-containing protein [Streptomyces sp. NBC_00124]
MGTRISLSPGGHAATLAVDNDIDDRARSAIESAATQLPPSVRQLTLDLADVGFVDSALLHLVLTIDRSVTDRGGLLRIVGLRPQPRRVLTLAADLCPEARWETYLTSPGLN